MADREQMMRLLNIAAWLALGSVAGAAAQDDAAEAARRLLADRGLQAKASVYVLPGEVKFGQQMASLSKVQARLDQALKDLAAHDALKRRRREELHGMIKRRQRLEGQLARTESVQRHNELASRYNALIDHIALLDEAVHDTTVREQLADSVGLERQHYIIHVTRLRALADGIQADYARLREDPEVTAALAELSMGRARAFVLGPRGNYASKRGKLERLELRIDTGKIPLRMESKIMWLEVTLNGRMTRPFVLDTGASDILLPADYATELGLVPGPGDPDLTFRVADGRDVTAKLMRLQSVAVGDFEVRNLPCVVLPPEMAGAPPLLGGGFLRHFVYSVDPAAKTLALSRVKP